MSERDIMWMASAIAVAREAASIGEVPVGAVVIDGSGENLLGSASNRTIIDTDPTAHAEILALRIAALKVNNYRLTGATVYSTIEPCAMCAGALVNARIARLVYGADDERFGAVRTHFSICDNSELNHRIDVVAGVMADECRTLMQEFFRARRNRVKADPTV